MAKDSRELYMTIAKNLKALRNARSMSQLKLANELGIAQQTYAAYETGENSIKLDMLQKIANFYGVSMNSILDEDNPSTNLFAELNAKSFTDEELAEIMNFVHFIELKRRNQKQ